MSEANQNETDQTEAAQAETTQGESKALTVGERVETLPSGQVARVRPAKGRHLVQAARGAGGDPIRITFGVIAAVTLIDDQPLTLEDLEDMPLVDVTKLMELVQGNGSSSPVATLLN